VELAFNCLFGVDWREIMIYKSCCRNPRSGFAVGFVG